MLSDSSRSRGFFIESGNDHLITSEEDGEGNSNNLDFRKVVSRLASSIRSYTDLNAAIVARDERQTLFFKNTFRAAHGRGTLVI